MPRNLFLTDDEANRIRNTPEYKRLAKNNPMRTTQDQVSEYAVKNANTVSRKRSESAARKQKEIESRTPQRGMGDSPSEFSSIPNQTSSQSNELESLYTVARDARKAQEKANEEYEALQAEWNADPSAMQSRLASPDYILSDTERRFASDKYDEYVKSISSIGKDFAMTPEMLEESSRMAAIKNKSSRLSGIVPGLIDSIPFLSDFVKSGSENVANRINENSGADIVSLSENLEASSAQNPLSYGAGFMGGKVGQYSLLSPVLSGTKFAQAAGNALGGTKAAQALSRLPILGHLATPQAISSIVGDTSADLALDTLPSLISDLYRYDSQQVDETIPESEKMKFSEVLQNAAGNIAGNVAFNAGGELLPSLFDAAKGLVRRANESAPASSIPSLSPQETQNMDSFLHSARRGNWEPSRTNSVPFIGQTDSVARNTASTSADEIIRAYNGGEQLSRAQLDTLKPNGSNRAAFESATGVKLPDTSSATRAFFSDATPPAIGKTDNVLPALSNNAPQNGVGAMKSQFDRDPVPTLDMQNQASVKKRLKNNRIDDLSNLGKQEHELYSDRQALYDAQNILDAETAYTGDGDAAIRNIIADLSERQMWDKEQIKTSQLIRDKLIDKANSARKGTEEYKAAIRELDDWIAQIDSRITASGQALQAWNESIKLAAKKDGRLAISLVERKINKMNKEGAKKFGAKWKDFVLSDAEKDAFKNATDDKAVQDALASLSKRLQKEYPVTMAEKVSELMRLFMLSGPASQARNFFGNVPMAGLGSVKRFIEGTAQSAYSKLTKGDFQQTAAVPSLSSRALARSVAKEKVPELLKNSSRVETIVEDSIRNREVFKKGKISLRGKSILENVRDAVYSLMDWGDSPFFKWAYTGRLASYIQAQGIKNADQIPQEGFDLALKEALEATFRDDNAAVNITKFIKKHAPEMSTFLNPFAKTSTNIGVRGYEYSPVGLVSAVMAAVKDRGADEVISRLSKVSSGASVIGLGYLLYKLGVLTGPAPEDKDKKAFLESQGWKPFAFRVGNVYYTFDWAQPAAANLVATASFLDDLTNNKDKSIPDMLTSAFGYIIDSFIEPSPVQTIKDILDTSYGNSVGENFIQEASEFPLRFIPSLVGATARASDPIQRSTYSKDDLGKSFIDQGKARLPGLSQTLPASYNTWGNEIKRSDSALESILAQFVSPGYYGKSNITPIDDDILALYESTGSASVFPRKMSYSVNLGDNKTLALNNVQHSEWQREAGQLSYSLAEPIVNSDMSDDAKADALAKAYSFAEAYTAQELFGKELSSSHAKELDAYEEGGVEMLARWYYLKSMSDGSPSQKETTYALDSMSDLTRDERKFLYYLTNSAWKSGKYD